MVSRSCKRWHSLGCENVHRSNGIRATERQNHVLETHQHSSKTVLFQMRSYGTAFSLDDRDILMSCPFDRYQHSRTSSVGSSLQGSSVNLMVAARGFATVSEQPMARFRIVSGVRGRRSDQQQRRPRAHARGRVSSIHRSDSCLARLPASWWSDEGGHLVVDLITPSVDGIGSSPLFGFNSVLIGVRREPTWINPDSPVFRSA
jgi:hypothetical protein